jgi:multidrug efflux system membrane fusion protein
MNDLPHSPSLQIEPARTGSRWRGRLIAALVTLLILAVIVAIVYRSKHAAPAGDPRDAPVTVAVAPATRGDIVIIIPALGTVTPLATVTVKTQIAGQLTQVAFREGQMVRAGDFLAQIDPRPYQAALEQAQATLQRDQALLANSKVDLQRYQDLIKENAIAQQQLDTQVSLVGQYVGTVAADQAAIQTAKVNLAYTHILSPVAGRLGLRQVDAGNYVTPQDSNGLVVVTQLQPISVIFPVPEDYMRELTAKLHDGVRLPVAAFDHANTTKIAEGTLQTIDNVSDPTTGTVKLRALFDNKDSALFANQFVNVRLQESVLHDQLIIPTAGVHHGSGETANFVYLVNHEQTSAAVRPITLGNSDGEHVAVTAGLAPGDVVVTEGADRLRDGARIIVAGPAGAPGATPAAHAATAGAPVPAAARTP